MRLSVNSQPLAENMWYPRSDLASLQIDWDARARTHYTLVMYDVDAPTPANPSNSPFVHLLVEDIPGGGAAIGQGKAYFPYELPAPPTNEAHRYVIALYHRGRQTHLPKQFAGRARFDLNQLVSADHLELVDSKVLVVDPAESAFYAMSMPSTVEASISVNPAHPYIMAGSSLSEREQAFCDCLVEVAAKQPDECNLERAAYQTIEGHVCVDPFRICARTIHTTTRRCMQSYEFSAMDDVQLRSIANLHGLEAPENAERGAVLSQITAKYPR
jgi:hypothetical protein